TTSVLFSHRESSSPSPAGGDCSQMASLLIPLLGRVAAKAGDALVAELLRAWGLDKARRKLERHLAAVQCILLDADAKSRTNPAVSRWVKDLKTAAYQADDVLDGFRYEALRRRATAQFHRCSTARKLDYFVDCHYSLPDDRLWAPARGH
uniref:Disease resistance N-terminal domain-containing protein n=1 Tax=Aegilops tauschii subsp. strangulata TaxID=200361 RepID=A0A452XG80_AEGTS